MFIGASYNTIPGLSSIVVLDLEEKRRRRREGTHPRLVLVTVVDPLVSSSKSGLFSTCLLLLLLSPTTLLLSSTLPLFPSPTLLPSSCLSLLLLSSTSHLQSWSCSLPFSQDSTVLCAALPNSPALTSPFVARDRAIPFEFLLAAIKV